MPFVLGLLVAASYGSADFLGGFSARTSAAGATVLVSQVVGLAPAVLYALALGASGLSAGDFALSVAAGLATVAGLTSLYRGLATGRASVVAPVSAVGAAVLQVTWGLARGESPGAIALVGVVLALVAVGIVAASAGTDETREASRLAELGYGVAAAVLLGLNLILFSETSASSGLWPVVVARSAPLPVVALVLLGLRLPLGVRRADFRYVGSAGLLDATANAMVILAIRDGLLSLVAPVAALYPAATVILARVRLQERMTRARVTGLAVALAGLVLIALR